MHTAIHLVAHSVLYGGLPCDALAYMSSESFVTTSVDITWLILWVLCGDEYSGVDRVIVTQRTIGEIIYFEDRASRHGVKPAAAPKDASFLHAAHMSRFICTAS